MKNVWEVCEFSDEITSGNLNVSKFAVELHSVLDNSADPIYTDPELFFEKTFLTSNAKLMLRDAIRKIAKGEGQSVYVIDTEFGGGKTHTILLLYHVFQNPSLSTEYIRKAGFEREFGITRIPHANVAAIDCRRLRKNTLWGEIAFSLGHYDGDAKTSDENKQRIKNIETIKSFFNEPTLLLIDELPQYLLGADAEKIGNVTLAELTINFIIDLVSAVSATKNTMLFITLTARQQLYEKYTDKLKNNLKNMHDFRTDGIVDDLRDAFSRQVQFKTPVDKKEIYDVVRTRLVKRIDVSSRDSVIEDLNSYYLDRGITTDPDTRINLSKAYPFHPFLIDTLYERVSTIDDFNKTRGVLRLLALALHQIDRKRGQCEIVSTSEI